MYFIKAISLVVFILAVNAETALALKGSKRDGSIRSLQAGLPVAGEPKEGAPKDGVPKEGVTSKEGTPKGDGTVSKDTPMPKEGKESKDSKEKKNKKSKKCKKAKKTTPPPSVTTDTTASSSVKPEGRFLPEEPPSQEEGANFCLQSAVTQAECQAAMTGKIPDGDQIIQADVAMDISYNVSQTSRDVLSMVGKVLKSETAADFIGCDNLVGQRFLQQDEEVPSSNNETTYEEKRVTGVDFKNLKTKGPGECTSAMTAGSCDSITSTVQIHYQGEPITMDDQQEMFDLLLTTITMQAAEGDFAHVGMIENIVLTSEITNSTSTGNSATDIAKKAGIPAGIIGAFLIIAGGILAYCCCMGKDNDDDDDGNNNNNNRTATTSPSKRDVVHAEAIAIIDDDEEKKKSESKFGWNPSKFL